MPATSRVSTIRKAILISTFIVGLWCMWPVLLLGTIADRQQSEVEILAYELTPVGDSAQRLHILYEYHVEMDDAVYSIMSSQRADRWGQPIPDPIISNELAAQLESASEGRGEMNAAIWHRVLYYDATSPLDSGRLFAMEDLSRYRIGSLLLFVPVICYLLQLCIAAFRLHQYKGPVRRRNREQTASEPQPDSDV